MGNPSLPLKFVFVFSFSLAVSSSPSSVKSFSSPKRVASDLISLLGSQEQAARINANEAEDLRSCLRFLVPFSPNSTQKFLRRRDILARHDDQMKRGEDDAHVWWPPAPVMDLARLAVDSAGDPAAIHRALDPTVLSVPDVEGCKKDRCELTRTPYGWRFINKELNSYLGFLFELIVARGPSVGLNVSLNRYDLFHGHMFLADDSGRLGILFHAKEYPAYDAKNFPYNMGYCQKGSSLRYDDSINLRNILWLAPLPSNVTKAWLAPGVLVVLDAHPEGIIYKDLISEYVDYVRTIYEDDFGEVPVDINYFNVGSVDAGDNIFIC
ncbi:T-box protein [Tasmannia lanceolata]|uniref:T-box protein n=1 Tax=Tasmannia lanceolata TaxID=3420 RepID=UPI0040628D86